MSSRNYSQTSLIGKVALLILLPQLLLIAGCGLIDHVMRPEESATTPVFDQMESATIELIRSDGTSLKVSAKIADTQLEQWSGFQFIGPAVIQSHLILFVFSEQMNGLFHMQNVSAPLDIAFIGGDGTLLDIVAMKPGPELYGIQDSFQFALEGRAGFFEDHQIRAGDAKLVIPTNLTVKQK